MTLPPGDRCNGGKILCSGPVVCFLRVAENFTTFCELNGFVHHRRKRYHGVRHFGVNCGENPQNEHPQWHLHRKMQEKLQKSNEICGELLQKSNESGLLSGTSVHLCRQMPGAFVLSTSMLLSRLTLLNSYSQPKMKLMIRFTAFSVAAAMSSFFHVSDGYPTNAEAMPYLLSW